MDLEEEIPDDGTDEQSALAERKGLGSSPERENLGT